ncbi:MAG TPA: type III-A CRISPR-associated RAMP protein Csm3 [Firmicutes bacterium]|nr:type III-A CRISPR-associated RAMP protein Csm3 [Bacillota bacterium]
MSGKLIIRCELEVLTGMHIGGTDIFSAIGAVDSPVIRDSHSGLPIVPGSSLKGKLRALLAQSLNERTVSDHNSDDERILRLFGSSKPIRASRLQFSDCFMTNADKLKNVGVTEIKSENTISRADSKANPRQIERVIPGALFEVVITYNFIDAETADEDLRLLAKAMKLLEVDYLGGHGSRGSGRVRLKNFSVDSLDTDDAGQYCELFREVESYELFSDKAAI